MKAAAAAARVWAERGEARVRVEAGALRGVAAASRATAVVVRGVEAAARDMVWSEAGVEAAPVVVGTEVAVA